jgi:glutamine amidotransferase
MIAVVDYGICNVGSVINMFRKIGILAQCATTGAEIAAATRIVVPGIGNFAEGMERVKKLDLIEPLREAAIIKRKPVLGICLGMQLLGTHSEEGDCDGIGIISARFIRFDRSRMSERLPIPHMGWREVRPVGRTPLLSGLPAPARFYFVHSYHAVLAREADVMLWADYGYQFTAAYRVGNIIGVQFHPEKSHVFGEKFLKNFMELPLAG